MPQRKQPPSLRDLCISQAARLLIYGAKAILTRHRRTGRLACEVAAVGLRDHFLQYIGHTFDAVCRRVYQVMSRPDSPNYAHCILTYLMVHEHTRTMHVRYGGGNGDFWRSTLGALHHVTVLDISCISHCTDATFRVIGATCSRLRAIAFSSKSAEFTWEALGRLTRCPHLEVIDDELGLEKFEDKASGLYALLHRLPKLRSMNYRHTGDLIDRPSTRTRPLLQLRAVVEQCCTGRHVLAIEAACPHLERLCLGRRTEWGANDALGVLALSSLQVEFMELTLFPSADILPMLTIKGRHLKTLKIIHQAGWAFGGMFEVATIGLTCPCLEEFALQVYSHGENVPGDENAIRIGGGKLFARLQRLAVNGPLNRVNKILQVCLQDAEHVERIALKICNDFYDTTVYALPQDFLATTNPMKELKYLSIHGARILITSQDIVEVWYTQLTSLRELQIVALLGPEVASYMRYLDSQILTDNVDLRLDWINLLEDGGGWNVLIQYLHHQQQELHQQQQELHQQQQELQQQQLEQQQQQLELKQHLEQQQQLEPPPAED